MTLTLSNPRRAAAGLLAAAAAVTVASPLAMGRLLVNETSSVPRGLYARTSHAPAAGRLVAVRQPAAAKAYLARLGVPASMPLLKRVAAVGGDAVCRRGDRLTAGDQSAPVLLHDRRGVALPIWRECRRLSDDEFVLLGDSLTSFDSRYFGPVRREALLGVYRPVLLW